MNLFFIKGEGSQRINPGLLWYFYDYICKHRMTVQLWADLLE